MRYVTATAMLLGIIYGFGAPATADDYHQPACSTSARVTPDQLAKVKTWNSKRYVARVLGNDGALAFQGTTYLTRWYGYDGCPGGHAEVVYARQGNAWRVTETRWAS